MLRSNYVGWMLAGALAVTTLAGCATDGETGETGDKGEEGEVPVDGAFDSFRRPTDHGAIELPARELATISADEQFHTWDFMLYDDATVTMRTANPTGGSRKVDTVLYLYREGATSWGSYIARNDDVDGTVWSQLVRNLGPGHYRALVKGYTATTFGDLALSVDCDGCVQELPSTCLLGSTYNEWLESDSFTTVGIPRRITAVHASTMGEIERDQLVLAVQQSAHDDVTTPEEAFARVDGGEMFLTTRQGHERTLLSVEFGAGDNSYGAIFFGNTLEMAAAIHDGELDNCTLVAPTGGAFLEDDCRVNADCVDADARCQGAAGAFGVCEPTGYVDGAGSACDADDDCGDNLVCAGVTYGSGLCGEAWLRRSFQAKPKAAIVDGGELRSHLNAYGLATVDTDVTLWVQLAHPTPSTLRVFLRNASGTEQLAWDGAVDAAPGGLIETNVGYSGDESVNGTWTLRIVDSVAGGGAGTLASWGVTIGSRWD